MVRKKPEVRESRPNLVIIIFLFVLIFFIHGDDVYLLFYIA